MMELKELTGAHVLLTVPALDVSHPFDKNANGVSFTLAKDEVGTDARTFFAFENPDDGYRSSMGALMWYDGPAYALNGSREYIRWPVIAHMRVDQHGEHDVLQFFHAVTGRLVLEVGTSDTDDYYPSFVAAWTPGGAV